MRTRTSGLQLRAATAARLMAVVPTHAIKWNIVELAGIRGDFDMDQEDFGRLQVCLAGSGSSQVNPDCEPALLDGDSDVDQADVGIFHGCMSGVNVIADPHCAD